ncbi:unnamed protein product [Prorocentrum cordatum]|uniref:Uncharacterized protein n=1 Tax=Prorocentrum cordatum TaxID=2364126 RepID=A0ABN9YBT0_9DINO|nr:unnamed protein product [Polarella glacialis]
MTNPPPSHLPPHPLSRSCGGGLLERIAAFFGNGGAHGAAPHAAAPGWGRAAGASMAELSLGPQGGRAGAEPAERRGEEPPLAAPGGGPPPGPDEDGLDAQAWDVRRGGADEPGAGALLAAQAARGGATW